MEKNKTEGHWGMILITVCLTMVLSWATGSTEIFSQIFESLR